MTMYEIDELKTTKEYKAASDLEDAVNNMSFKYDKFAKCLSLMHPTLQQNMFRLIAEMIKEQAREDRSYDDRNKSSHELAKKLIPIIEENYYLPHI